MFFPFWLIIFLYACIEYLPENRKINIECLNWISNVRSLTACMLKFQRFNRLFSNVYFLSALEKLLIKMLGQKKKKMNWEHCSRSIKRAKVSTWKLKQSNLIQCSEFIIQSQWNKNTIWFKIWKESICLMVYFKFLPKIVLHCLEMFFFLTWSILSHTQFKLEFNRSVTTLFIFGREELGVG